MKAQQLDSNNMFTSAPEFEHRGCILGCSPASSQLHGHGRQQVLAWGGNSSQLDFGLSPYNEIFPPSCVEESVNDQNLRIMGWLGLEGTLRIIWASSLGRDTFH